MSRIPQTNSVVAGRLESGVVGHSTCCERLLLNSLTCLGRQPVTWVAAVVGRVAVMVVVRAAAWVVERVGARVGARVVGCKGRHIKLCVSQQETHQWHAATAARQIRHLLNGQHHNLRPHFTNLAVNKRHNISWS